MHGASYYHYYYSILLSVFVLSLKTASLVPNCLIPIWFFFPHSFFPTNEGIQAWASVIMIPVFFLFYFIFFSYHRHKESFLCITVIIEGSFFVCEVGGG